MAIDVTEATFDDLVVERSRDLPVVVDFWASWCAPCRFLGPILERVAADYAGRVELVKVDTDAAPNLSAAFGIRGIPAVKAFRDGEVIDEFVGAQPEAVVRDFFEGLVALEQRLDQRAATVAVARERLDAGDLLEARRVLVQLPADAEVSQLLARIDLAERGVPLDDPEAVLADLLARVADGDRDEARALMLKVFEVLGPDDPLTRRYRPELARVLF